MAAHSQRRDPRGTSTGGRFAGGPPRDGNAATQRLNGASLDDAERDLVEWTRATGKEYAALYGHRGGLIRAEVGTAKRVVVAPEAWAIRQDGRFTHTHPRDAAFSDGDFAFNGGLKEFRAVGVDPAGGGHIYSLSFSKPGAAAIPGKSAKRIRDVQDERMRAWEGQNARPAQHEQTLSNIREYESRRARAYNLARHEAIDHVSREADWAGKGVIYSRTPHNY